ncbi:hypothetical protein [Candidatus Nitrosocosmicus hydrocola]|uniref:hypothetical protein n=1 Tax=Candidatus Nitrosocosmicus hydrocola TaxID=1826872 RepID=UPI00137258B3|nr:hypothetical protein [Candidatus Nitrosocosmicus hydrocola]
MHSFLFQSICMMGIPQHDPSIATFITMDSFNDNNYFILIVGIGICFVCLPWLLLEQW